MQGLENLVDEAQKAAAEARDLKSLDDVRVRFLGKKGLLTEQLKQLGQLPESERPAAGQAINLAKQTVQDTIEARRVFFESAVLDRRLASEAIDVTLPGRGQRLAFGEGHPR